MARMHAFTLSTPFVDPQNALERAASLLVPERAVLGVGEPLTRRMGVTIPGLRPFPALVGAGVSVPATQAALFCLIAGSDRGELYHQSRRLCAQLMPAFVPLEVIEAFVYRDSRDLTGYEDGTENPKGEDAIDAVVVSGKGAGLDGGTFLAVQRYVHALARFEEHSLAERDAIIGRSHESNEELEDAPESAHVKRAARERFDPPAFMLRRSMPYVDHAGDGGTLESGLMFLAYVTEIDTYERVLRRMLGQDDAIVDALFSFSQPKGGGYYFCLPAQEGRFDLKALGI